MRHNVIVGIIIGQISRKRSAPARCVALAVTGILAAGCGGSGGSVQTARSTNRELTTATAHGVRTSGSATSGSPITPSDNTSRSVSSTSTTSSSSGNPPRMCNLLTRQLAATVLPGGAYPAAGAESPQECDWETAADYGVQGAPPGAGEIDASFGPASLLESTIDKWKTANRAGYSLQAVSGLGSAAECDQFTDQGRPADSWVVVVSGARSFILEFHGNPMPVGCATSIPLARTIAARDG